MEYWLYENWTAENKAVIHRADCGHCNYGKGCHPNPLGEKNGRWLGPYHSLSSATKAAKATGREVRRHRCLQR